MARQRRFGTVVNERNGRTHIGAYRRNKNGTIRVLAKDGSRSISEKWGAWTSQHDHHTYATIDRRSDRPMRGRLAGGPGHTRPIKLGSKPSTGKNGN